jgi:hypothetical protein
MCNFRIFPGGDTPENPAVTEREWREVEEERERGRKEKGERGGQLDPQVQKPGGAPALNMKCCIPRLVMRADNHW